MGAVLVHAKLNGISSQQSLFKGFTSSMAVSFGGFNFSKIAAD